MENRTDFHPNIVLRRHIKSTAKAGKVIIQIMNDQIAGIDSLGTITKICLDEHIQPLHARRFFSYYVQKGKQGQTRVVFDQELIDLSKNISDIYRKVLELDRQKQKTILAIVTHMYYTYPIGVSR